MSETTETNTFGETVREVAVETVKSVAVAAAGTVVGFTIYAGVNALAVKLQAKLEARKQDPEEN